MRRWHPHAVGGCGRRRTVHSVGSATLALQNEPAGQRTAKDELGQ